MWSDNGTANRLNFNAGDQLTAGSWVYLQNELNPVIDGIFTINSASTGVAGAAISLLGCSNVVIKGSFGCNKVFDASRTGTNTQGVYVENVLGFTFDTLTNTLYSGANVSGINYRNVSVQALAGVRLMGASDSYFGLICGPGTQTLVSTCVTVGGQRSTALTWGTGSGTGCAIEMLNSAHGYGEGIGYFPCQNIAAAGHAFLVKDAAATNGQRNGLFVGPNGSVFGGGVTGGAPISGLSAILYDGWTNDGNTGTAKTIDLTVGAMHKAVLTGNVTLTLTLPTKPTGGVIKLTQDATGSRTVTWPAATKFPLGVSQQPATAASSVTYFDWFYDPDIGLNISGRGAYS